MQITVYSTRACPYCDMLKDFLQEKNLTFIEKYVDDDIEARNAMMEKSDGFLGVPFTVISKDDKEIKIIGFDKNALMQALES